LYNDHKLKTAVLEAANVIRVKVSFIMYRMGCGAARLLAQAHAGIREWFDIGRPAFRQMDFFMLL
jgi:hypothetical protein